MCAGVVWVATFTFAWPRVFREQPTEVNSSVSSQAAAAAAAGPRFRLSAEKQKAPPGEGQRRNDDDDENTDTESLKRKTKNVQHETEEEAEGKGRKKWAAYAIHCALVFPNLSLAVGKKRREGRFTASPSPGRSSSNNPAVKPAGQTFRCLCVCVCALTKGRKSCPCMWKSAWWKPVEGKLESRITLSVFPLSPW